MKRKQTAGERISARYNGEPDPMLVRRIDRAIRRAQAEAWEEGIATPDPFRAVNPYRGKKRAKR